jgi:Transglycosylase
MLGLMAVTGPAVWFYSLFNLPLQFDSAMDIESALRQSIESERQAYSQGLDPSQRKSIKWPRPDSSRLPKRLTALFIMETGCPTYFQTPREDGWPWFKRVLTKLMKGTDLDGDGACELIYARSLASRLGADSPMRLAVAADRIHHFLEKDQLVSFNLASFRFEDGLIGVEAAARDIMQKDLSELQDAELAELQLAIPPWSFWEDIRLCTNAGLVRRSRDQLLERLAGQGLISDEMAKTAMAQPVRCLQIKR